MLLGTCNVHNRENLWTFGAGNSEMSLELIMLSQKLKGFLFSFPFITTFRCAKQIGLSPAEGLDQVLATVSSYLKVLNKPASRCLSSMPLLLGLRSF